MGFILVAPPSGAALVCQDGHCFALRSGASPSMPAGTGLPHDVRAMLPTMVEAPGSSDWVWPDSVVGVRRTDGPEMVGAIPSDLVREHLGGVSLGRLEVEQAAPSIPGLDPNAVKGMLTLDETATALAATPQGSPERMRIIVSGVLLDLTPFEPLLAAARATGTLVEFVFAAGRYGG